VKQFLRRYSFTRNAMAGPLALRRAWLDWRGRAGEAVLERIGKMVKGDVVFEAKEFDGVFSIDPRSHLLHRFLRKGYYEPQVSRLFLAFIQPHADVLDIGANIGFYTVAGARRLTTGRLLAAEPTGATFKRLSENVRRNGVLDRVLLFNGMIGANKGQGQIHFVPGMEEYSSMKIPEHLAVKNQELCTETVPIERVDDLVDEHDLHPAVLKVDVEGAEFSVFKGALNTISKYRPVVISEIWKNPTKADGHSGAELVQMFENLDYVVRDPHDPLLKPGLEVVGEIICIPRERFDSSVFRS
jgi:FkbM family methyltransferase